MVTKFYVTASTTTADLWRRLRARTGRPDGGISTLEVVVIALGLFILAGALVAAITAAVNSRMNQIN